MSAAKKAGTMSAGAPAPAAVASATQTLPASPRPSTTAPSNGSAAASVTSASRAGVGTGRKVRLTVSRIDPWSAMKMSFLVSVALGIALVVMTAVLWTVLAGMNVFSQINSVVGSLMSNNGHPFDILDYVGFGRVVSLSIVVGVVDVVLLTAISTIGAFIYNVSANLVGGLSLTLTDD